MLRFVMAGLIATTFWISPVYGAKFIGTGAAASAELPVQVKILDFQATSRICGSDFPPAWCPAHLLRSHDKDKDEDALTASEGNSDPDGDDPTTTAQGGYQVILE